VELYLHSLNRPSMRGAQLKHRDKFTFTFIDSTTDANKCDKKTVVGRWLSIQKEHSVNEKV
jgi:hypothetical protein